MLAQLRADFPDVTISKIRFLEAEGLVEPARTPSGYRKFSHDDVERLRYVLTLQRDHYLPLRVIREHLDALDRGLEPPARGGRWRPAARARRAPWAERAPTAARTRPRSSGAARPAADPGRAGRRRRRSTSDDLRAARDVRPAARPSGAGGTSTRPRWPSPTRRPSSRRTGSSPATCAPFRTAADREVGLVEQVVHAAAPRPRRRRAGPGRARPRGRSRRSASAAARRAGASAGSRRARGARLSARRRQCPRAG